jgi:dihydrolipoamide dehydrogenase
VPSALAIVGAGYIGLELGTAFAKLGSTVTVIETTDSVLPQYDAALTRPVARRLGELGITVMTGTRAEGYDGDRGALTVRSGESSAEVAAERVLVTVGRVPLTTGWGLERLDLTMNGNAVAIDDRCRTSMSGVYAIGDLTGSPMLAHRASAQGELVADVIAGKPRRWDVRAIPEICYTDPEVVVVGRTPEQAKADGVDATVRMASFAASGRAMTLDRTDGFVRIVARSTDQVVLGVQAVGANVSELSGELALAIEMGATAEDLARTVHAHPTLTESIAEGAHRLLRG